MYRRTISYNNKPLVFQLRDEADESVCAEIFKWEEYRVAAEQIRSAKHPIIDVGAHAGFFTLYARSLNQEVPIIAIEPEKNNNTAFEYHLKVNNIKGVVVVVGALVGNSGVRELILSSDSHTHRLKNEVYFSGHPLQTTRELRQKVKGYSFSELVAMHAVKEVSLLKMDIEGGEYEVFAAWSEADFGKVHALIMEYHTLPGKTYHLIEDQLRTAGFGVQIFPSKFDKSMGFLWAQNKRLRRA